MEALEAIYKRKSIRSYTDEQIPEAALSAIVKAGQDAPTAGSVHFSVVQDAALLKDISATTKTGMLSGNEFTIKRASLPGYEPLYSAPTVIFLSSQSNVSVAVQLAVENIIIAATALGFGTCYLMSPTSTMKGPRGAEFSNAIGIPEGYQFVCAVALGYTKDENAFSSGAIKRYDNINYIK